MIKYFLEVCQRIILTIFSLSITIIVSYLYKEVFLFFIYQYNNYSYFFNTNDYYFIFTDVSEVFIVYMRILFFINVQYCILYSIFNISAFIIPSLYKNEYYFFSFMLKFLFIVWLISIIFYKCILIPLIFFFFLSFYELTPFNLYFEAKLNDYLSFLFYFYYNNFIYFQITSFIFSVVYFFNTIKTYKIKKFRKLYYFFLIFLIIIISPPNPYLHIFLTLLIILFFEYLFFTVIYINSFIKLNFKNRL